ncbi:DIS3-like exonuclease 2 [Lineus longissimus]|uniref:DIS3-like exonuclease 2 n=1 Tax=Lineus longissimus TaxID=88925 RepID=UPI002B4DD2FF
MAEGGSDFIDPLSVVEPIGDSPASSGIIFSPRLQKKTKADMDQITAQLEAVKLESPVEKKDGDKSFTSDLAPANFKFGFKLEKDSLGDLGISEKAPESDSVFSKRPEVLDSGSDDIDEDSGFVKVEGEKKKKRRRGTRGGRQRSKKSEEEMRVVVDVLEAETSFTILPKSEVKELACEMNGEMPGQVEDRFKSSGKSNRVPKRVGSMEKLKKSIIADVVGHADDVEQDNTKKVKSRSAKLPDIVDSSCPVSVSGTSRSDVASSRATEPIDAGCSKKSSSRKRRERRKKEKVGKNVALASLLSRKPSDFDDDSDELPELVKQFLEKNGRTVESSKMSNEFADLPRNEARKKKGKEKTRDQKDKEGRGKFTDKVSNQTPVKEGCYSKLLKEHNIRERHDSLPAKFDRRHGSSPVSFSPGRKNRDRYYSQSYDGQFDMFDEASQSPRQSLFPGDVDPNNTRNAKEGRRNKKHHQNRDGTPESQRPKLGQGQGRRNTEDGAYGNNSPRNGMSPARPRSHSEANQSPQCGLKGTPKGMTISKNQTPRQRDGRGTPNDQDASTPNKQGRGTPRSASKKKKQIQFEPYLDKESMSSLLKQGNLIEGSIRINPKNYEDAYVPHPDGSSDVYIKGLADRNRALNGDVVVVQLLADDKTPLVDINAKQHKDLPQGVQNVLEKLVEKNSMRCGKVVGIVEKLHSRACTGHIKPMKDKNQNYMLFSPIDHRMPRIKVPAEDCPKGFLERPGDFANTLFVARIKEWEEGSQYAKGNVQRSLGEAGEIEPETEGMLNDYGVDYSDFSQAVLESLPKNLPWTIPESELQTRKDLRKEIVFTVDPASARDLDDALSCVDNGDGTYEIGVHIADVSYFVKEQTELDCVAASRATSVYLVQKVVPMLPRLLCEQLCSLNPDEDRLTFSVIWKMTETGEILDIWFGRSVIRSCVKLSYDHAQGFLDEPDREWTREELPPISDGVSIDQIKSRILIFDKIAKNLRAKRADNGALRLDQVKLMFVLDKETGLPCGWKVYQGKDSNKLIEEFMLLANMSVANKIRRAFPEKAMLRCHPPPKTKMIQDLMEMCETMDIPLDATSSGALHESLSALYGDDEDSQSRLQILTVLCSKPMQLAKYFCTGTVSGVEDCWHYALSVPEYTHFTSPIRRYPDVIVHRQLAAALGLTPEPNASKNIIQRQADHCNLKKSNAKRVSEMSSDMFFAVFVKESGPIEESGMVMSVLDRSFDVLILKFGVIKRVYTNKHNLLEAKCEKRNKVPRLTLVWKEGKQTITLFTKVQCIIESDPQPLKWNVLIKPPYCDDPSTPQVDGDNSIGEDAPSETKDVSLLPTIVDGEISIDKDATPKSNDASLPPAAVAIGDVIVREKSDSESDGDSDDTSGDDVVVEETIETVLNETN